MAAAVIAVAATFLVIVWNMKEQPINITPYMRYMQQQTGIEPQRRWVSLDSISPEIIKAVIACEDNNFFYHYGFDIEAIKEAMERNQSGKRVYGASTITQQMVKNVFLSHKRTWLRKVMELGLSVMVEAMWGKARIMEVYLNVIETGANMYGIETAAQNYFHKHAKDLDRRQACMIAIALPSPRKYNPAKPSRYMNQRYEQLIVTMDKLMKYGWYKDIKDIRSIKINYLENYPHPPRMPAAEKKVESGTSADSIWADTIEIEEEIVEEEEES
jgi:monofunctional biosynthetic peptidoglycan transglycosylase